MARAQVAAAIGVFYIVAGVISSLLMLFKADVAFSDITSFNVAAVFVSGWADLGIGLILPGLVILGGFFLWLSNRGNKIRLVPDNT